MSTSTQSRRPLAIAGLTYFGSVLVVGLPLMYAMYVFFVDTAILFNLNLGAAFLWQILLLAVAFLIGISVAGKVAERVLKKFSKKVE